MVLCWLVIDTMAMAYAISKNTIPPLLIISWSNQSINQSIRESSLSAPNEDVKCQYGHADTVDVVAVVFQKNRKIMKTGWGLRNISSCKCTLFNKIF